MTLARPKPERHRNKAHLDFVRQLPCIGCACEGVESPERSVDAAHVSFLGHKGFGSKVSDLHTVPLCRRHHDEQHSMNERLWWARLGVNAARLCGFLVDCDGDLTIGRGMILSEAQARARPHRLVPAGQLAEPVEAAPQRVTIAAHLAPGRDANGNCEVILDVLGPRGNTTATAHVSPGSIMEGER